MLLPLIGRRAASALLAAAALQPIATPAAELEFVDAGPKGFQYADKKVGTGSPPVAGQRVAVDYRPGLPREVCHQRREQAEEDADADGDGDFGSRERLGLRRESHGGDELAFVVDLAAKRPVSVHAKDRARLPIVEIVGLSRRYCGHGAHKFGVQS